MSRRRGKRGEVGRQAAGDCGARRGDVPGSMDRRRAGDSQDVTATGHTPAALALADDEPLLVTGDVRVERAGRALARRTARHRGDTGPPALIQGLRAGHLDRCAPRVVRLADHERLPVTVAVDVDPADRAVAPRGARLPPYL